MDKELDLDARMDKAILTARRLRESHDRLLAALKQAREIVQNDHDSLIDSYDARMGTTRMAVEESGRRLAAIDAAITEAETV